MMTIELMACKGCWRVVDQYNFGFGCDACGHKLFRAVGASKWNLFRWFMSDPKHVSKVIILDLRGKEYE